MAVEDDVGYPARSGVDVEQPTELITNENGDSADATPPVQGFEPRGPFSSVSVVDLFQHELGELTSAETVFIPVKGYEQTGLQIQYRMPQSGKELDAINVRVMRQTKDTYTRNIYTAMDIMIHLCEGLYVQPQVEGEPEVPEPVMLDPEETGEPVGFDTRLAKMMGMEDDGNLTARKVVKRLFGDNEMAVMAHCERLSRWLQNTKADLNAEMWQVGE